MGKGKARRQNIKEGHRVDFTEHLDEFRAPFIAGGLGTEEDVEKELEREIEFFDAELDGKLRNYTSKYVAIKNQKIIAEGETYGEVSEKVRRTPYVKARCILIRKVEKERPIHFVSIPLSTK